MRKFDLTADDLISYFGANLTAWMRFTGNNAKTLAEMLEVTPSMMSYIMTGSRRPGLEMVARTLNVTGMTPGELFAAPEFVTDEEDPMESLRSIAETHAKLGAQIRNLYDRLKKGYPSPSEDDIRKTVFDCMVE